MIQTALIAVILILVVTFFSSPSKEDGKTPEAKQETLAQKEKTENTYLTGLMETVEIEDTTAEISKVDVIIPGIPAPVALPKVSRDLDFKNTVKLVELLEREKALKEEALAINKRLQKDLAHKKQNEAELQALLAKVAKMAEAGEMEARIYEQKVKEKIQSLEKGLLENVHDEKELQVKIENFPSKMDELLNASEEISQKAENELQSLSSEKEALAQELERLKSTQN